MRWLKIILRSSWIVLGALLLGFIAFANMIDQAELRVVEKADGIVVLTGGQNRISGAVKLLAKGRAKRMLISGVNKQTSKAALSRLTPKYVRLFECCIDVGYKARDTIGNAAEIADWARERKFSSLIVVTASYHMPRSIAELKQIAPNIRLVAFPVVTNNFRMGSWWSHSGTARLLFSEYAKYLNTMGRLAYGRIISGNSRHSSAIADVTSTLKF